MPDPASFWIPCWGLDDVSLKEPTADGNTTESSYCLVERQGQCLGVARGAPRRRLRHRWRPDHGDRYIQPRQHAWGARGTFARATQCRESAGACGAYSISMSQRDL